MPLSYLTLKVEHMQSPTCVILLGLTTAATPPSDVGLGCGMAFPSLGVEPFTASGHIMIRLKSACTELWLVAMMGT